MLALTPPPTRREQDEAEAEKFEAGFSDRHHDCDFIDFGDGNLLDCIDFDDLFTEIEGAAEAGLALLPDLEIVDHELSAMSGGEDSSEVNVSEGLERAENNGNSMAGEEEEDKSAASRRSESGNKADAAAVKGSGGGKKSLAQSKNSSSHSQGKKKVKVDWTPELHRKFVQAVEQLGLDKAVPSKILEIMGTEGLTRHNIASHLQKYRSHRKHLLAREAEAASWNHQRRQMTYTGGKVSDISPSPWLIHGPAMGFPPPPPPHPIAPPRPVQPPFSRPLHVWGHPPAPPPRPAWPPLGQPYSLPPLVAPPMDHNAYWNPHHHPFPNAVAPGTPCFPPPRAFTGLISTPPVPGVIPPNAVYKVDPDIGFPSGPTEPQPPPDFHPSTETLDAVIGDALTKPWQPLPLGLKPPSLDGVLKELQRQGIPDIPPSSPS